jgi:iron complex outermembrane receptor protein
MLSALFVGASAFAQEAAKDDDLTLEEVLVTGTKREVAQQDLSVAVTTVSAKQIEASFQNDVTALAQMAPNVVLTPQVGFNAIGGGMRGTGFISILVTKDPSVGISVDEFVFNHVQSQFVEMFDIDQVEIYRGPQGTLFGKNTTGGAIAFSTKKPVLGEFFGNVEANLGQFSSNDSNYYKVKFALNVPLGETLAARLAIIKDKSQGFYTNDKPPGGTFNSLGCPPGPGYQACINSVISTFPLVGDGSKIGGADVLAAKLKFRWEPTESYAADLVFEYARDRGETQAAANETPNGEGYIWPLIGFPGIGNGDPFSTGQSYTANAAIDIPGGHQIDAEGFYLTQTFKPGNFEFKSITGYRTQDEILASTYTGEAYTSLYDASRNSEREQFQQEFRLTSQFDGRFNFTTGAAYFTDDVNFVVFGSLGFFLPLAGPGGEFYRNRFEIQNTKQDRENTAFYVDGSYDLTDKAKLTLGYRYTEDKKDFLRLSLGTTANPVSNFIDITQYRGPFTNPLPESAFGNVIRDSKTFSADTYRAVFDYRLSDDVLTYISYATGFVSGGFSETCGSVTSCAPYASEENKNLEIGIKADLLEGKLRFNAALFETKYDNLQRDTVVTIQDAAGNTFQETQAVNEGKSTARGLEIEASYVPQSHLRFDAFLGLLDHSYDSYNPSADPAPLGLTGSARPFDFSALDVTYSPDVTAGAAVTLIQDLASEAKLTYNLNLHYMSEFETNPFPANAQGADSSGAPIVIPKANTQGEARTLVNAFVTWNSPSKNLEFTLYGKNLTDEVYRVAANPVATLWNFTRHGPPRELGVQVGYKF